MLVDDEDDARGALAALLRDNDYQVLEAHNGAEALRLLKSNSATCRLILLDLMMPVMNGWDFRRHQRRTAELAAIPVVLMSAGAKIAIDSDDLDAADFIAKPVEIEDLLETVRRHTRS
ncbi:MAG TPA: response regulator [Polyangia bacterium]